MPELISYGFEFAGLKISLETEVPITITRNFQPFMIKSGNYDCRFIYQSCEDLGDLSGEVIYSSLEYDILRKSDGKIWRISKDAVENNQLYAVSRAKEDGKCVNISFLKGNEAHFDDTNNSFSHSRWEEIMMRQGRAILHAALVETSFGGLLFAGPSGIGKSTQAGLWKRLEQAQIINGDRPILYKEKKSSKWLGCGSPYAGSSNCYVKKSLPVKAIIFLNQGEDCRIQRLSLSEAFKKVYANCTVYSWNKAFVEGIAELAVNLAAEVPIYSLQCTPDRKAVEIVKKELTEEEAG